MYKEIYIEQLTRNLLKIHGEEGLYKTFSRLLGYEQTPPTIQNFINDNNFLGDTVGGNIYLPWRQALYRIYPTPFFSPYSEIIITGAIGTGKTTVGKIGCIYDLLRLVYLENPQEHFNLIKTTRIAYAIMNATLDLAGDVIYDEIHELMMLSPVLKNLILQSSKRTLLPKGIDIFIGSRISHTLGMAVVGCLLDEANFTTKVTNQIQDNYNSIKARIESRFLQSDGSYPARMWLLSSRNKETDFLDIRINESRSDPSTIIFDYPIWEIQKHKINYCGDTFNVFIGDGTKDPKVLLGPVSSYGYDDTFCIEVPVEYQRRFEIDINVALRDLAGVSTAIAYKFISSVESIESCLFIPNPVKMETVRLDFWDRSEKLAHFMEIDKILLRQFGLSPRYIHLDMAVSGDALGIASSFISEIITVGKYDPVTGVKTQVREPQYVTEFIIQLKAKSGNQIPFYKVKEFLVTLNDLKYPIGMVTMDGFQSTNLMQDLNLLGIRAEYLSVDRTKDPYQTLKDAILERRWIGPKHTILSTELKQLVDTGKKIDHPLAGCFIGSTSVSSPSGEELQFEEIHEKFKQKEQIWIYTLDFDKGVVKPGLVSDCFITKYVDELIEIELDNGHKERCTPDHLWMLRDGSYKEAQYLQSSDSLMPLYRKYPKSINCMSGYRMFYNPLKESWHFEHRQFCTQGVGKLVHHINFIKDDNTPPNLLRMFREDHAKIHNNNTLDYGVISKKVKQWHDNMHQEDKLKLSKSISRSTKDAWDNSSDKHKEEFRQKCLNRKHEKLTVGQKLDLRIRQNDSEYKLNMSESVKKSHQNDPTIVERISKSLIESHKENPECFQNSREAMKSWNANPTNKLYRKIKITVNAMVNVLEKCGSCIPVIYNENKCRPASRWENILDTTGINPEEILRLIGLYGVDEIATMLSQKNHKVVAVTKLSLGHKVPVYDLTVEGTHNFALSSGVFVHNSKDLGDACAGSVYKAYLMYLKYAGIMGDITEQQKNKRNDGWTPTLE